MDNNIEPNINKSSLTGLKGALKKAFSHRALATTLFTTGNLTLAFASASDQAVSYGAASALLLAAALCYKPSEKHPSLLGLAGGLVITAQGTIAAVAEGAGQLTQRIGTIPPIIQGALLIRAAYNEKNQNKNNFQTNKPYLKLFERIDKYPILSGAIIEAPGVALLATGAAISGEWLLAAAATQWTITNVFLGKSDPKFSEASAAIKEKTNAIKRSFL